MTKSPLDRASFEQQLGVIVSESVFASIATAGPALYLALQEIWAVVDADPRYPLCDQIKGIASRAFTQATN